MKSVLFGIAIVICFCADFSVARKYWWWLLIFPEIFQLIRVVWTISTSSDVVVHPGKMFETWLSKFKSAWRTSVMTPRNSHEAHSVTQITWIYCDDDNSSLTLDQYTKAISNWKPVKAVDCLRFVVYRSIRNQMKIIEFLMRPADSQIDWLPIISLDDWSWNVLFTWLLSTSSRSIE